MKTCIITGASSGIGRSTAIIVSKSNLFDNIILVARDTLKLEETKRLSANNDRIVIKNFDLNNLYEIPVLIKEIGDKYGSIDCLMNIAGFTDPQPILQTSIDNLFTTYTINVFAPIILIRECVKYMKRSDSVSKIINIGSTAGVTARPGWLSYASSKAALISASLTLSEELIEYKIKSYIISPGRCATDLRRKLAPNEDQSLIMQPDDVANIIIQLLQENEMFLDGQNIIVRKK